MRFLMLAAMAALLTACAAGGGGEAGPNPFPVARGSALAPPVAASAGQAPPEGVGAGGFDFGPWRTAEPAAYAAAFEARLRERFQGRSTAETRADLEANGFACREVAGRLECRIEIMERGCGFDWYAVLARNQGETAAGFDKVCLHAR